MPLQRDEDAAMTKRKWIQAAAAGTLAAICCVARGDALNEVPTDDAAAAHELLHAFDERIAGADPYREEVTEAASAAEGALLRLLKAQPNSQADSALLQRYAVWAMTEGRVEEEIDVRRLLLRLRPDDERNQMMLLTALVRNELTIESRLAQIARMLGEGGVTSHTLRSRLQAMAAGLMFEIGRRDEAEVMLQTALLEDSTNAEAAWARVTMLAPGSDADQRIERAEAVARADAVNPEAMLLLAEELARARCVEGAIAAIDTASAMMAGRNQGVSASVALDRIVLEAARGDTASVQSALSMTRVLQAKAENNNEIHGATQRLAMIIGHAAGLAVVEGSGVDNPLASLGRQETRWLRAWLDVEPVLPDLEAPPTALESATAPGTKVDGESAKDRAVLAINAARQEEWDQADRELSYLPPECPEYAIARFRVEMLRKNNQAAARSLLAGWREGTVNAERMWCKLQLERMLGQRLEDGKVPASVEKVIDDVWARHAGVETPLTLDLEVVGGAAHREGSTLLRLTWRNQGRDVLRVGPNGELRTDLALEVMGSRRDGANGVSLGVLWTTVGTKWRLRPGEVMQDVVELPLDDFLQRSDAEGIESIRIKVISAAVGDGRGGLQRGSLGVQQITAPVGVAASESSRSQCRMASERIGSGIGTSEDAELIRALTAAWDEKSDAERARLILTLPANPNGVGAEEVRLMLAVAARRLEPLSTSAWIVTRSRQSDDAVLQGAIREGGEELRKIAVAARDLIEAENAVGDAR